MNRNEIKIGDVVVLTKDFSTGVHDFHKGDKCIVTYKGFFCLDIELKDDSTIWVTDLSYDDVKKVNI